VSSPTLTLTLWGTRGSCAGGMKDSAKYGGNTTCISIETTADNILIIDAGTGIRHLGDQLATTKREIFLMLTHVHWDHIQGFPFFAPLYQDQRAINFYAPRSDMLDQLLVQMDGTHFPIEASTLPSTIKQVPDTSFLKTVWQV